MMSSQHTNFTTGRNWALPTHDVCFVLTLFFICDVMFSYNLFLFRSCFRHNRTLASRSRDSRRSRWKSTGVNIRWRGSIQPPVTSPSTTVRSLTKRSARNVLPCRQPFGLIKQTTKQQPKDVCCRVIYFGRGVYRYNEEEKKISLHHRTLSHVFLLSARSVRVASSLAIESIMWVSSV